MHPSARQACDWVAFHPPGCRMWLLGRGRAVGPTVTAESPCLAPPPLPLRPSAGEPHCVQPTPRDALPAVRRCAVCPACFAEPAAARVSSEVPPSCKNNTIARRTFMLCSPRSCGPRVQRGSRCLSCCVLCGPQVQRRGRARLPRRLPCGGPALHGGWWGASGGAPSPLSRLRFRV